MIRRFAEVFEIDAIFPGSIEQQTAVEVSLTPEWGTLHHRLLQRLDRQVNSGVAVDGINYHKRSFLRIGFHKEMTAPGTASPAGFNLSAAMGYKGCHEVARHELGHIVDFWLLSPENRIWFQGAMHRDSWPGAWESWAEAFREWLDGGWQALTQILVPDADPV